MTSYHYTLTADDNDTWLIQFPDIPEAAAVAESADDTRQQATEGLEAGLQLYIDARRPIPAPQYAEGGIVSLSLMATAKLLLSDQMVMKGVRKAELARRLGVHPPQVDRLLELGHASRIESVEAAITELGRHLEVVLA